MSIGIGGAGSKLASVLDRGDCTIVNVSDVELDKVVAREKLRAVIHKPRGQFKGARKDPAIGRSAFPSISEEILTRIRGEIVFASTGGGTGNGLAAVLLERLNALPAVDPLDKTTFAFVLPYPDREAAEYVDNTIHFLSGPLSQAIDGGNTGNIVLFTNREKFLHRVPEAEYNAQLIDSLQRFLAIPQKGADLQLLDGHIDSEDFSLYQSRPYFNHFCQFDFDPAQEFAAQFKAHHNPLLLPPADAIECLFLLEVPEPQTTPAFYGILDHFAQTNVAPVYSVVHNPALERPLLTLSVLYSRKPLELVDDFVAVSEKSRRTRLQKSVEQHVTLTKLNVDMEREARQVVADTRAADGDEILATLKRLGKL
jgi:hypothetical protein